MQELIAIGSQYPKALSRRLAEVGDDPASPAGQQLVRASPLSCACALHINSPRQLATCLTSCTGVSA